MTVFEIHPLRSAGELMLGADRESTRSLMERFGLQPSGKRHGMDYYAENSIQLDFFDDDLLHYIGFAHSPYFNVVYAGVDPFDISAEDLHAKTCLNEQSPPPFNDYDPLCSSQIISLWDAQQQYDHTGHQQRNVFATFAIGDRSYLDDMLAIQTAG